MKNKKIALFMLSPLTQGGGAEKYFINLARNLGANGSIEADVITFDDNSFRRFVRLLHIFARGNFFGKIDDYERGMREKREGIEKELGRSRWIESPRKKLGRIFRKYDAIYAKNELADLFVLKMIGYKKLPSVIVGVHTPIHYPEAKSFASKLHNFIYSSFFYKWLLRGTKTAHVSNASAKELFDEKFGLNCNLIYYPFSTRVIFELGQKNKCDITFEADKKNIIFIGRLGEQKGSDILINIIQKISKDETLADKIRINVFGIGDKKYQTALEKMAEEFSFVRYSGHIENKFIPHILSQQDLMIAPSKWETLPYSILEAQALGLPVIAFDIPGPSDIIKNNQTGFLARNEEEFFDKIKDIVEGKISFDKNAIIRNIEKKFGPEKIHLEMINMFEKNIFTPSETGALED